MYVVHIWVNMDIHFFLRNQSERGDSMMMSFQVKTEVCL